MKKFFFLAIVLLFSCYVLADKTADTINYVVNDSTTMTTIIKSSSSIPPPEVRWSITGIVIIVFLSILVYISLKRYGRNRPRPRLH